MAIVTEITYIVKCDNCGEFGNDKWEPSTHYNIKSAEEGAFYIDFIKVDDKHYCNYCAIEKGFKVDPFLEEKEG